MTTLGKRKRRAGRRDFGSIYTDGTTTDPRFSVMWEEGGKRRRKRGFGTRTEAEQFLARIRTALSDGVLDAHRKAEVSLSSVGEEWLRSHSAVKLRSHDHNVQRWRGVLTFFGSATLSAVSPTRILEFRGALHTSGMTPATVNLYLALLRTVLNYAVTAGYLQASPVRRFARGAYLLANPRPKRSPPLTNEEATRLLGVLRADWPQWHALFAFLLFTGARRGEAAGLRWNDVDLERRLVTIRRSYTSPPKSGNERTVPITTDLAALLAEHRKRDSWGGPSVFPQPHTGEMLSPDARLAKVMDAACSATGVRRMRIHDLRHAHASLWLMAGGTLTDVQRNLGHSTPVLTASTYGHIADDHRVRESDVRLTFGTGVPAPPTAFPKIASR